MFKKNQRICIKNNPAKRGIIFAEGIQVNGYNIFSVMFDDGRQSAVNEVELMPEVITESAWEKLANNLFGDHSNYAIASTVNKIRNASSNTISTLKASKTIFKPYQFIPLIKLLNSDNKRIIIADEVGLGKTIEAGHIILEFASRGYLNNFLVVCLNSIQEKWKDEMENKFNIKLKIYNSLADFKEDIKEHKNNGGNIAGIINYDKFRSRKNLEFFKENAIALDMIVFDEAHHLRNSTNARNGLKNFTSIAKSVVMLTATPIMTSLENLYSLINLLDEKEYSKYEVFQNNININKPFIRAFNDVSGGRDLVEIAQTLINAEVEIVFRYGKYEDIQISKLSEVLKDDGLMISVLDDMNNKADTRETRALIKQKLVNLNTLNHIYSRTRKNQVLTDGEVVKRNASVISVEMSDEESAIYDEVVFNYENAGIGAVQVKRKMASSLFANNFSEIELKNLSLGINFNDSKYNALKAILKQKDEKVIIFSFFRKTLLYLQNRLMNDGFAVTLIYGGIDVQQRNNIIEEFRQGKFQILLASEVGSTGLDMQFCDCMVNYDLPWNPMVIEQRIGRIDRIGQKSDVINIFNLIHKNTIEERIYKRLYDRINIFRESLGNLDEILGEKENYFEGIIEEIYRIQLSDREIEERLDTIANAVENNKLQLQEVEDKLKDSFSNDAYFSNEIKSIEEKRKYIQPHELKDLINRIIANHLTTLIFTITEQEFVYVITQNNADDIFHFIESEYDASNFELTKIFRDFKKRNYSKSLLVTFDQEYAFTNKNIEYISAYHPLINAISNYFVRSNFLQNTVYKFSLDKNNFVNKLLAGNIQDGLYFLINYNLIIKKNINNRNSEITLLKTLLIDLQSDDELMIDDETAEFINSEAQFKRESLNSENSVSFNEDFADVLSTTYTKEVFKRKSSLEENEKLIFESEVRRKLTQEIAEIERRIKRIEYNLENNIGLENPQISEVNDLEDKKKILLQQSEKSYLEISDELVSLNLIHIYG